MGTRHLIICKIDKKIKVANYGQWDGYLDGQGVDVAKFIEDVLKDEFYLNSFKNNLRKNIYFLKGKQLKEVDALLQKTATLGIEYPRQFSRDTGAEILNVIKKAQQPLGLIDSSSFSKDHTFCEYSYVLDFDKNVLEVYTGGATKKNLFKKLKFSEVTADKMLTLAKELEEKRS